MVGRIFKGRKTSVEHNNHEGVACVRLYMEVGGDRVSLLRRVKGSGEGVIHGYLQGFSLSSFWDIPEVL